MGVRAISVRSIFNKKFKICTNILRSYMICFVYVFMYGYEMVCISMHEYLLAPSKVWTVPQPISQPFEELPGWNLSSVMFTHKNPYIPYITYDFHPSDLVLTNSLLSFYNVIVFIWLFQFNPQVVGNYINCLSIFIMDFGIRGVQ